jgi:alkylhydroperoxidase family enzyme
MQIIAENPTAPSPRIAPAEPPYDADVAGVLRRLSRPSLPALALFTTLARDRRLFLRLHRGGLLDPGHISLHQREIVIGRITALSGSEYEWGVHTALFAEQAAISSEQQRSLVSGSGDDACWNDADRDLLHACDQLHAGCDLDDNAWNRLRRWFSEEAIIEILMLAGFYRMVSYLTNALRLRLEPFAPRFSSVQTNMG